MEVLYEDNHIIVVIKPHNVPSQEDETKDLDMLTMVKSYIKQKYNKPGNVYVGLVHRLDRPTGGIMVFAKTSKAASRLTEQLKTGELQKTYLAVVKGELNSEKGELVNYLVKNEKQNKVQVVSQYYTGAKRASLEYTVIGRSGNYILLKINLHTGRSHQIRVQLKNIGLSIVGDKKYGDGEKCNLALWACQLRFVHPTTKQVHTFKAYPDINVKPWNLFNISL